MAISKLNYTILHSYHIVFKLMHYLYQSLNSSLQAFSEVSAKITLIENVQIRHQRFTTLFNIQLNFLHNHIYKGVYNKFTDSSPGNVQLTLHLAEVLAVLLHFDVVAITEEVWKQFAGLNHRSACTIRAFYFDDAF